MPPTPPPLLPVGVATTVITAAVGTAVAGAAGSKHLPLPNLTTRLKH